jgi:hypothetical protein
MNRSMLRFPSLFEQYGVDDSALDRIRYTSWTDPVVSDRPSRLSELLSALYDNVSDGRARSLRVPPATLALQTVSTSHSPQHPSKPRGG